MFTQKKHYEATVGKEKRKARYCDLEGHDDIVCDYYQHGSLTITDQIVIPDSS